MARPPIKDKNARQGLVQLGPIPGKAPVASFNADQFESLIQTKGLEALHYKHAPNPDREALNGPVNPNTQAAHRGWRYYEVRKFIIVPQNFKLEERMQIYGIFSIGSVVFNVSGYYIDDIPGKDKQTFFRERDLIVMPTLSYQLDQLFEYNPNGPQKLRYYAKGIDYLADKDRVYEVDRDYEVKDGLVHWTEGGKKPSKSTVLTVVYWATPIYVVENMLHSNRVIPSNAIGHAALPRDAVYAPQQVVCKPSGLIEETNFLNYDALPPHPDYPSSINTTGGSV